MATLYKGIGDVRRKLLFPDSEDLDDGVIGEYYIETVDYLLTEMNQTPVEWNLQEAKITVNPEQDYVVLDSIAPNYSKGWYLWTMDESDTTFRRRPVSIVPYDKLTEYYDGGDPALATLKHSAEAASLIYDSLKGQNKIVFAPIPSQSADYKLIYEPAVIRPETLSTVAFRFDQFDGYVSDLVALRCCTHANWKDFTKQEARERRDEIRQTLAPFIETGKEQFERFTRSNRNVSDYKRIAFGRRRRGR